MTDLSQLKILPDTCAAHFPDKPLVWLVRGTYRTGGLRGQSCSASLYTPLRTGHKRALEAAAAENDWMAIRQVRRWGRTVAKVQPR